MVCVVNSIIFPMLGLYGDKWMEQCFKINISKTMLLRALFCPSEPVYSKVVIYLF